MALFTYPLSLLVHQPSAREVAYDIVALIVSDFGGNFGQARCWCWCSSRRLSITFCRRSSATSMTKKISDHHQDTWEIERRKARPKVDIFVGAPLPTQHARPSN